MDLHYKGELDQNTIFTQPTDLDTSYSIGEIMHQHSITALDHGSGATNTSVAAEQSSRNVIVAALPKSTSVYVLCNYNTLVYRLLF